MGVYSYVARDESGAMVEGEVTALSEQEAARSIRAEGKFPVKVGAKGAATGAAPARNTAAPKVRKTKSKKYKSDDLIFFTSQMAVMVETGVSLADALDGCVHDGNSPRFAAALDSVIDQVRGGSEFSAALASHPNVFPQLYVSLIKASEASGQLAPILVRLSDHLERQREISKKIKGAITYPIVMMLFAIGVTVFLISFVLPKFAQIYAGREDALPVLTRTLLSFSDMMVSYGLYALGGLVAVGTGLYFYLRTPNGKTLMESIKLGLPLIGPLFHKTYLARSLRTLGTMIQSGVSMLESVQLTTNVCGNQQYEKMWNNVNERVESGQQISEALEGNKHVPKAVLKMLSAGERSGQLGQVMGRVAGFCETELNVAIKALTSMIEPAIVMFLGVVVGGLVLALLLPIFTISKAM